MPEEKGPLSIFSRCFVASACVSRTESRCARCPCRGDVCAVAGRSASYSYLVLKHQALAHRRSSCFCDRRPLLAAGGCDQTQGPGSAGVTDGVTSPPTLTGWYAGSARRLGSLIRHGGSRDAARSLAVAALSARREEGSRPYPRGKDVCLSLKEGPSEGRHAGAALAGAAPSRVLLLGIAAAARRPPCCPWLRAEEAARRRGVLARQRRGRRVRGARLGTLPRVPGEGQKKLSLMFGESRRCRRGWTSPSRCLGGRLQARGGAELPVGSGGCSGGCPRS